MRISTLLLTLMLGLSPVSAIAGMEHSHGPVEVTRDQAEKIASYRIADLVQAGEIPENWAAVGAEKSEKAALDGDSKWVIVYSDNKVSDPEKRQLSIFLSATGEFISFTFTGK